jgi:hypothetical protein
MALGPCLGNSAAACPGTTVNEMGPECQITLRTHGRKKSHPSRTRGQWGEPYGVTAHKKRGVLIIHSTVGHNQSIN